VTAREPPDPPDPAPGATPSEPQTHAATPSEPQTHAATPSEAHAAPSEAHAAPSESHAAASGTQAHAAPPSAAGVRLIIGYKAGKGVVETFLAIALALMVTLGYVARAHDLALAIREHLVHRWSIRLAEAVLRNLTARHVYWLIAAVAGDAGVSFFEAWALWRGYLWAPWVVVGATGLLLPIEVGELFARVTLGRFALLAINVAIVTYLARGAWRAHRAHAAEQRSA
jgi:uncharacterized membrane protein (DUF2068 family)